MKQRGFTLVELSIVVAVIGLLLVSIFGGQSLINQAKAKNVIAITEDLRAAVNYFTQRYKYLPGDWPYTAGEIPNVVAATTVGTNGNGIIEGVIDANGNAAAGSEVFELPWQLFNAGFLGKIDQSNAQQRLSTSFGAVHVVSRNTAEGLVAGFTLANPTARSAIVFFHLPCEIVNEVDNKTDDGSLTAGRALGTACGADGIVQWYAIVL